MPVEIKELVIQGKMSPSDGSSTSVDAQSMDQLKQELVSAVVEELQQNAALQLQDFAEQIITQALDRMEERMKQQAHR